MKGKFLLFLGTSLILIILVLYLQSLVIQNQAPKLASVPFLFFGELLEKQESDEAITFIAVGDVMLGRSVNAKMRSLNDFNYPFLKTANFLKVADLAFINLESPFYDDCPTTNTGMIFCADPKSIEGLVFAGVDIANLANNHVSNYGQKGISLTKTLLQENSVIPIGPEPNLVIEEVKGTKFGFLGFDLTSGYQEGEVIKKVQEKSSYVDFLIVSFHWGAEYAQKPSTQQVELAHRVIEAGADLILGHHPHVIQPTEEYQGKVIVYSLGNFVFDQPWSEETKKGLVGIFTFQDKNLVNSEFKEVYIQDYSQPEFIN